MQYNTVLLKKQEDFLYLIKISIGMRGIAPLCGAGNEPPFSFRLAPIRACGRSRFATRYPGGSGSDSGKRSRASRFCSPMHGSSASRAARLQVSAKQGDPAKTQRSGSRGERSRGGVRELSPSGGSEGYAARGDAVPPRAPKKRQAFACLFCMCSSFHRQYSGLPGLTSVRFPVIMKTDNRRRRQSP